MNKSNKAPDLLRLAEWLFFNGDNQREREHCYETFNPVGDMGQRLPTLVPLMDTTILVEMTTNITTAFNICLSTAKTAELQRTVFRKLYNLPAKINKSLTEQVSPSLESRDEAALHIYTRKLRHVAHQKAGEVEHAIKEHGAVSTQANDRKAELAARNKELSEKSSAAIANVEIAKQNLPNHEDSTCKGGTRKSYPTIFIGPRKPFKDLVNDAVSNLAETDSELDQLKYRFHLLKQTEYLNDLNAGEGSGFDLLPTTGYKRIFISITKSAFQRWMPEKKRSWTTKLSGISLRDLLPDVFHMDILNQFVKKNGTDFGDSFRTDGIQLQLPIVNEASKNTKARKLGNKANAQVMRKEAETDDKVYLAVPYAANAPKVLNTEPIATPDPITKPVMPKLPPKAKLVGYDPGRVMIGGFVRLEDMRNPFTITTKSCHTKAGVLKTAKQWAKHSKLERDNNTDFKSAIDAVGGVSTKTSSLSKLVHAAQVRSVNFATLYKFYGSEKSARVRLLNHQGKESVITKLVNQILPTKEHVLIAGDGYDGSGGGSLSAKFVRKCKEMGRKVILADEHRSSILCSVTHLEMHHPPRKMCHHDYNEVNHSMKHHCRYVFGLYQSSCPGGSIRWNRDKNAPRNILINFLEKLNTGQVRKEFRREYKPDSKPKSCSYKYTFGLKKYAKCHGRFQRRQS